MTELHHTPCPKGFCCAAMKDSPFMVNFTISVTTEAHQWSTSSFRGLQSVTAQLMTFPRRRPYLQRVDSVTALHCTKRMCPNAAELQPASLCWELFFLWDSCDASWLCIGLTLPAQCLRTRNASNDMTPRRILSVDHNVSHASNLISWASSGR